jgi:hypothetical protein
VRLFLSNRLFKNQYVQYLAKIYYQHLYALIFVIRVYMHSLYVALCTNGVWCIVHRVTCIVHRASCTVHRVTCIVHRASCNVRLTSVYRACIVYGACVHRVWCVDGAHRVSTNAVLVL